MQTSAHFIAQAFFCEDRDQRDVDDHTHGQDDRRPDDADRLPGEMSDAQLQRHAEGGDLNKKAQGIGEHCERQESRQQRKNLRAQSQKYRDGETELPEPCVRTGHKGNQKQIHGHRRPVGQQRQPHGHFAVEDRRKGEDKEAQTAADHKKRPERGIEHENI